MADFEIIATIAHKGPRQFACTVKAMPTTYRHELKGAIVEIRLCRSSQEAEGARDQLVAEVSDTVLARGDRVVGVELA